MGGVDPYPELYQRLEVLVWKPTIADVHTNPNDGTGLLPGPNVLHVATGDVFLMVLAMETCDGPEAFVGPVFSYYEVDVPELTRRTDADWKQTVWHGEVPPRPEWTRSFVVGEGQGWPKLPGFGW